LFFLSLLITTSAGLYAPTVQAAPKDSAAQKIDREAMDKDYLNVNFPAAEKKLRKALKECGSRGCSTKVKIRIHMHLGIVLVNAGKGADASAAFTEALGMDANATPDQDFASPDVMKAFEKAKGGGGASEEPVKSTKKAPKEDAEGAEGATPPGDLTHTAVTEQALNTPVPVFAQGDPSIRKMLLNYKPYGGEYTKVDMRKMGKGYGGTIPCKDTSAIGTLTYYIVALDANGDPVGNAGSKKEPYKLQIRTSIDGEPPTFPNQDPPKACKGADECPPGIQQPGCEDHRLPYGSKCNGPGQCEKGLSCNEGVCQPGDEEAEGGPTKEGKKNWFTFAPGIDVAFVSSSDVCSRDFRETGSYLCFKSRDGSEYLGVPPAGRGGTLNGFAAIGTIRFLLGYDRAFSSNFLLGTRLGFAVGGSPKASSGASFLPFHAEVRATLFFGKDPLAREGIRPYAFLGGGIAQIDAKVPGLKVEDDCGLEKTALCAEGDPEARKPLITVDAWKRMGAGFAGTGLGMVYAFSSNSGLFIEMKFSIFFGVPGFALSPSLGYLQGFLRIVVRIDYRRQRHDRCGRRSGHR